MQIDRSTHRSPNHGPRTQAVASLLLHTGEGSRDSDLAWLKKPQGRKSVSAHYYVTRAGTIYQLVDENREAWHAGLSHYAGLSAWGPHSIGVESEHKRGQDWPARQRAAIRELCLDIVQRYHIAIDRRVAHRWIAPTRKSDPTDWPDDELFAFFVALGGGYAQPWRPYRVTADGSRVRSEPGLAAPVHRKLNRGNVFWGTEARGASVGGSPIWIARRYGGYVHKSLVSVARDLESV